MVDLTRKRAAAAALFIIALLFGLGPLHSLRAEPASAARAETASAAGETPEKAACDRAAFRLVVDVGHTKEVPGAISARGLYEYEFNLRLAKLVVERLNQAGFDKTLLLVTGGRAPRTPRGPGAGAHHPAARRFLFLLFPFLPTSFFVRNW